MESATFEESSQMRTLLKHPGAFRFIICLLFLAACRPARVTKIEPTGIQLNASSPADSQILKIIEPYKVVLEKEMNQVLVISDQEAVKGQPEGTLGNLIADITLNRANKVLKETGKPTGDISLLNNGGLRSSLPKGEITTGKIFELMPFENSLVVLTLTGNQTMELVRYLAKTNGAPVSGLRLDIVNEKPENILIQNAPIDTLKNYRVVTSDYLASGGDKMRFFNQPVNKEILNKKIRDAIIEYMLEENEAGRHLNPTLDQRIRKP